MKTIDYRRRTIALVGKMNKLEAKAIEFSGSKNDYQRRNIRESLMEAALEFSAAARTLRRR